MIGLDKKEFGRMLLALTGSTYGTAEQFTRFVDGEFRVADMDRDGLVCEDEFYLYYWKRVIFIVPPALVRAAWAVRLGTSTGMSRGRHANTFRCARRGPAGTAICTRSL